MRHAWKALFAVALIVGSSEAVRFAAYSGPVIDPGGGDDPIDDPVFPPTFCVDGADCAGCYSACLHAYDDCMNSQPYCHMGSPGPRDPRCEQVCGRGQNRCFTQAVANCR